MVLLNASNLSFRELNEKIRSVQGECEISACLGQRFIGAGMSDKKIALVGTPGNALGAYLNGAEICVKGNVQDAVGDTMNDGKIIVHGNIGDAAGYAMRGGSIFVKGDAGYRAGIHMKAYQDKSPVIVIGGCAGSFLGEYQAGGMIIVLGLHADGKEIVGNFPCTGMHGGKIALRSDCKNIRFPKNVQTQRAAKKHLSEISGHLAEFCAQFDCDMSEILCAPWTIITPDSKTPYKQMYIMN